MNNPFLSDRNIFSKVINPLKKKPEVDKRQSLPTQTNKSESLAAKSNDNNLSSNYQTLKEKPRLSANLNNNQAIQPIKPISKMSFGKTQEMDNRLSFNNNFAIPYKDQVQYQPKTANQYQKVQNYNFSSNESNNFLKNDYKSLSLEQNVQLTSPNQEYKFQEYRKANNFNECSPIQQQASQKLQDSQFLNIDAIGEDLNKFLASSKNQEEICKLLGLNMQPKNTQQIQPNEKPYQIKKVERVSAPRQQPNVGSIFTKQKKEVVEQQYYTPQYPKNAEQYHKEDKQYVPTFNYAGLDQQNEVLSREEEYIPRFAGIPDVKKTQRNQNDRQSIQVFNYSQNNVTKTQPTLQDLINEEMNALSWNGKYRTFLTSAEKIVTYKYKLQHL